MAFSEAATCDYPVRIRKKPVPEYRMAIAVVIKAGRLLIVRRPLEAMLGGLWEFPGGRLLPSESAQDACRRIVREAVGLNVSIDSWLTGIRHGYTHFRIAADVFVCRFAGGRIRRNGPVAHCWVGPGKLDGYPFAGSNHKIFPALMDWYADRH
jgi:A/G-specific adenine glycosylase